jgi:hypothetical protein
MQMIRDGTPVSCREVKSVAEEGGKPTVLRVETIKETGLTEQVKKVESSIL